MGPPYSLQIPRVCRYSGFRSLSSHFVYETITLSGWFSQNHSTMLCLIISVLTPTVLLPSVWPLSLSLATTREISVDFSSSSYLDVSVQRVPFPQSIYSTGDTWFCQVCFHIQKSADRSLFAAPRGLSQLVTSFFGS